MSVGSFHFENIQVFAFKIQCLGRKKIVQEVCGDCCDSQPDEQGEWWEVMERPVLDNESLNWNENASRKKKGRHVQIIHEEEIHFFQGILCLELLNIKQYSHTALTLHAGYSVIFGILIFYYLFPAHRHHTLMEGRFSRCCLFRYWHSITETKHCGT